MCFTRNCTELDFHQFRPTPVSTESERIKVYSVGAGGSGDGDVRDIVCGKRGAISSQLARRCVVKLRWNPTVVTVMVSYFM